MDESRKISGKKFARLRSRLLKTQQELANALEMSLSGLRRVERSDETTMQLQNLRKLVEVAGVPLDELLALIGTNGLSPPGRTVRPCHTLS